MNSKHTPGPWYIGNPDGESGPHYICTGGAIIAELPNVPDGSEYVIESHAERRANARLFKASPELLEFVEYLSRNNCVAVTGDCRLSEYANPCIICKARALIAEIEGGSDA